MYEWMKALHIIAVISWMAGLLYLPRLFIYHVEAETGSRQSETFKIMERRLLKIIMTPAMIATWVFGLIAAHLGDFWVDGWFHVKFLLVVVLTGIHFADARWVRQFATDSNTRNARFFRIVNEIPTVLMILIVILVVVRPF